MSDKMTNTANDDATRPVPAQHDSGLTRHDGASEVTQVLPATPDPGEMPTATLPVAHASEPSRDAKAPGASPTATPADDDATAATPRCQEASEAKNEPREVPYLTGNAKPSNAGRSAGSNTSDGPFKQPAGDRRSDGSQPQNRQVPLYAGASSAPAAGRPQTSEPPRRKSGPNAGAMVLGSLTILLGVLALIAGLQFPYADIVSMNLDGRMAFAVFCGVLGLALIVVAVIWTVVKLIANRARRERQE